jgi:hypothetical protein
MLNRGDFMDDSVIRNVAMAILGMVAIIALVFLVLQFHGSAVGNVIWAGQNPIGACYRMDTSGQFILEKPIYTTAQMAEVQRSGTLGECKLFQ